MIEGVVATMSWQACDECSHYSDTIGCDVEGDMDLRIELADFVVCGDFERKPEEMP